MTYRIGLVLALVAVAWTNVAGADAAGHTVACEDRHLDALLYLTRPSRCALTAPSQTFGLVMNLRRLRWHAWGSSMATARGREGRLRVRVRAWRPRELCGDIDATIVYTRMRVRARTGLVTVRQSACPAD